MKSFWRGFVRAFFCLIPVLLIGCCVLWTLQKKSEQERLAKADTGSQETAARPDNSQDQASSSEGTPAPSAGAASSSPADTPAASAGAASSSPADTPADGNAHADAKHAVTLTFAGDILFTERPLAAYDAGGVSSLVSDELLSVMTGSDLFMLNEEFPFSTRGTAAPDKQFTFRVDPSYVKIFQELGVDIVTVANNHALDFGPDAFTDSLDTLDRAGIRRVGGGRTLSEAKAPVIETAGGWRIGFLGASRVFPVSSWAAGANHPGMFSAYDPAPVADAVAELKASCDYVVLYVHWGIEKDEFPQDYQRQAARAYIDAGADLVIGSHPHVMQGFEYYSGKLIAYSLGNFLFSNSTNKTVLLQVSIGADGSLTPRLIPCTRSNGQMQLLEDASYYPYLESLSFGTSIGADGVLSP